MTGARIGGVIAVTAAVLLGALVGPSAAQGGEPYYQIEAEADENRVTIEERFGTATFEVTVVADGQQDDPFDSQVTITYTANYTGTPPEGWSTPEIDPQRDTANPGEEVTFTVTVRLTSDEPQTNDFRFNVRFTSNPQIPSQLDPLFTGANEQSDSDTVTLTASKSLTTSEAVTAFADQYKWFLLIGAAGIFLLAIVLVRRKKSVDVTCSEPTQEVLPGRGASFPVRLHNDSGDDDTFFLSTSELPAGWNVLLPVESIEIGGGAEDTVWVTVKAPGTVRAGERVQFELFASSRSSPGQEGSVQLEVVVVDQYRAGPAGGEPFETVAPEPGAAGPPPDLEIDEPTAYEAPKRRKAGSAKRKRS